MATPAANANGHRRRQLVARVLAEESNCGICDQPVDKTLNFLPGQHGPRCTAPDCDGCIPDPLRGEVDEIIPRKLEGSPLSRSNVHLTCRRCNQMKSDKSLEWARREAARRGWSSSPQELEPTVAAPTTLVDW